MGIWMTVVLAAAGFSPQDGELPRTLQIDDDWKAVDGVVAGRLGVWAGREFSFQSTRTDSTQATSKQQALFSASVMGGVQFYDHFLVLGTYEADAASKISAQVGGAYVGWREHPKQRYGKGVPDEVMIYVGVLVGRIDVHKTDFGAFDRGIGFGGGIALGWTISPRSSVQFYGEYRSLKFNYERDVLTGDKAIGGNSGWFGLGFDFHF